MYLTYVDVWINNQDIWYSAFQNGLLMGVMVGVLAWVMTVIVRVIRLLSA